MARRYDPTRALVALVLDAVERGAPPAELVEVAQGRRDVLEAAPVVIEQAARSWRRWRSTPSGCGRHWKHMPSVVKSSRRLDVTDLARFP